MVGLASIQRTMISKVDQEVLQYAEPVKPKNRLPASNPSLIAGAAGVGLGGLQVLGGRRLKRMNPADPRSTFSRRAGKRLMLASTGLAAYGAYARNRNKKNGFEP